MMDKKITETKNSPPKLKSVADGGGAFGNTEEILKMIADEPDRALVVSAGRIDVIESVLARKLSGVF